MPLQTTTTRSPTAEGRTSIGQCRVPSPWQKRLLKTPAAPAGSSCRCRSTCAAASRRHFRGPARRHPSTVTRWRPAGHQSRVCPSPATGTPAACRAWSGNHPRDRQRAFPVLRAALSLSRPGWCPTRGAWEASPVRQRGIWPCVTVEAWGRRETRTRTFHNAVLEALAARGQDSP